jgi:TolC family type I secretion outer membrane protein
MFRKVFYSILLTFAFCSDSLAQDISLKRAYETAKVTDPQWRLAKYKQLESLEFIPQALSQLLPNLSLSVSTSDVTQQLTNGTARSPEQQYPSSAKTLTLRQGILRPKQKIGLDVARVQLEQSELTLLDESQQLALRVMESYFATHFAFERQSVLDAQKRFLTARLAAAESGLKSGQGMRTDRDEALADLARLEADDIQVKQSLSLAQKQFLLLTGLIFDRNTFFSGKNINFSNLAKLRFESSVDSLQAKNLKIKIQEKEQEIRLLLLKQAEAGHTPTLDFVAQVAKNSGESSFFISTQTNSSFLGFQLNVPLYSGGQISSQVNQTLMRVRQSDEQLEIVKNNVEIQFHKEFNSFNEGLARLKANSVAIETSAVALDSSKKGVLAGTRTQLDILRLAQLNVQAKLELLRSKHEFLMSWVRLKYLFGELGEQHLILIDDLWVTN